MGSAGKIHDGTDVLVRWYYWPACPAKFQAAVLAWIKATGIYTATLDPAPMVMVHPEHRQIKQDACEAHRQHFDSTFDCEIVVPFGDRSIVVWFNQMPAPLAEV